MPELSLEQAHDLRVKTRTAALLARRLAPSLLAAFLDELRATLPRRRYRTRKSLRIAAFAVGVAAAGVVTARLARSHSAPSEDAAVNPS